MAEHVHQRTRRAGFFIPRAKNQGSDSAMYHRPRTHHAGLQRDVQGGIEQAIVLQHQSALAKRHNFGVRGRIVAANRTVPAFPNHLVVINQHGTYGHFALIPGALSQR